MEAAITAPVSGTVERLALSSTQAVGAATWCWCCLSDRSAPVVAGGGHPRSSGRAAPFVVVLAGLGAVGAKCGQTASGLLSLFVTRALGMLWLATRHPIPVTLAWSTPGAALWSRRVLSRGG